MNRRNGRLVIWGIELKWFQSFFGFQSLKVKEKTSPIYRESVEHLTRVQWIWIRVIGVGKSWFAIRVKTKVKSVTWVWNLVILHSILCVLSTQESFHMRGGPVLKHEWLQVSGQCVKCRVHSTMFELRTNVIPSCISWFSSCQMFISLQWIECKRNQLKRRLEKKI